MLVARPCSHAGAAAPARPAKFRLNRPAPATRRRHEVTEVTEANVEDVMQHGVLSCQTETTVRTAARMLPTAAPTPNAVDSGRRRFRPIERRVMRHRTGSRDRGGISRSKGLR